MFRTVPLSIIRSLFTVHSAMVYVIQVCRQLSSRTDLDGTAFHRGPSCSKAVYKPVWRIPLLSVQWINSWWWTEELSETCRVSCQNKVVKFVHLVGFIIKKIALGILRLFDELFKVWVMFLIHLFSFVCLFQGLFTFKLTKPKKCYFAALRTFEYFSIVGQVSLH